MTAHLSDRQINNILGNLIPIPRAQLESTSSAEEQQERIDIHPLGPPIPVLSAPTSLPQSSVPVAKKTTMNISGFFDTTHLQAPFQDSMEIAAAVRQIRHATLRFQDGKIVETGLERHNFPRVNSPAIKQERSRKTMLDDDSTSQFQITLPELIVPVAKQYNVTFETGLVAKFLLVARNDTTEKWTVPSSQRFHDILNTLETKILKDNIKCGDIMVWNSEWSGGIGLMGLRTDNREKLFSSS